MPWSDALSLSWATHVQHVVDRSNRLFAQCVSWCRAERLPLHTASSIFLVHAQHCLGLGIPHRITHCPQESGSCVAQVELVLAALAHWFACLPSCILDARNMGHSRTQHVASFLDHLHLSSDGGLNPKSVISLTMVAQSCHSGIASLSVVHFSSLCILPVGGGPDPTTFSRPRPRLGSRLMGP